MIVMTNKETGQSCWEASLSMVPRIVHFTRSCYLDFLFKKTCQCQGQFKMNRMYDCFPTNCHIPK